MVTTKKIDYEKKLWRINNAYYDLRSFYDNHPGGKPILERSLMFDDHTQFFEAQHQDFRKVRETLSKFKVRDCTKEEYDEDLSFSKPNSFYDVARDRVLTYINKQPTRRHPPKPALIFWWFWVICWSTCWIYNYITGSWKFLFLQGFLATFMAGYGHMWIHLPKKYRYYALCIDVIGLTSNDWLHVHVLAHHTWTNFKKDPHFLGTAPFLIVDPYQKRNIFMKFGCYFYHPIVLVLGSTGNYFVSFINMIKRGEKSKEAWLFKMIFPLEFIALGLRHGFANALVLHMVPIGISSYWYFTIALINHNQKENWDMQLLENEKDWARLQMVTSTDLYSNLNYYVSCFFMWLNYHTVHHLFPNVDQWHHRAIQQIMIKTAREFGFEMNIQGFFYGYADMLKTFSIPRALEEILG